ncbi:MAG: hypothetical protein P4L85_15160 [Paludisphaera borealis]|uniref:hypothetical protein n=1 Tax=Paludisphaera borealis TaxID=1387353 RepID=UPI00285082F3|nr:hypothetical protein [Paludisphaera borealis]MDR3620689.1 hypothetical protein [Paludisphaera borealis]
MDGRKRTILEQSLALGVAVAAQWAVIAPCHGQATPSSPGRTSGSATIPPPVVRPDRVDPEVRRSSLHGGYPSSQQSPSVPAKPLPSYAPPAAAPPPAAPPAAPAPPPSYTPAYAPPYAPAYAPGYSAPYAPAYGPQYGMMVPMMPQYQQAPPQAPQGNFFLPNSAPVAPPAAPMAPAYAASMAPAYAMPMAPAYAMPMAAPPQPAAIGTGVGLAGSSVSVPTSGSMTSVEVRGPGMLAAGLARFGERLVQLGRTRVRTVQETVLQTPQSQPLGGTATIATTGTTPIQPPFAPAAPPAPPAREEAPPEAPTPSPQGGHSHQEHSLIKHLLGHK